MCSATVSTASTSCPPPRSAMSSYRPAMWCGSSMRGGSSVLITRSTSGMWWVMARSANPGPRSNWLCWRRSTTALKLESRDGLAPDRGDPHRIVGPVEAAGPHPPAVAGRPAAGIAHVEAALDVEVPRALPPAHAAPGRGRLRPSTTSSQRLLDERAIHRCLLDYCRGVDRGDPELVASVYHADGTDDHGSFKGLGSDFAIYVTDAAARAVPGDAAHHRQHDHRLRG